MNASVNSVKSLYGNRLPFGGWGDFKHQLVRAGVIASVADDVPAEWKDAFLKALRRLK